VFINSAELDFELNHITHCLLVLWLMYTDVIGLCNVMMIIQYIKLLTT